MNTPPADPAGSRPPRLLDQLRDRIRLKHYSLRTGRAYAQWVKRYIYFHGRRHPAELTWSQAPAVLEHTEGTVGLMLRLRRGVL